MKPIDWDKYNEPPYLPQWLCEGETLELARFDDPLRKDVERQVLLMVGQYGLDNIEGEQLDRIGNLLSEPRLGNDDDLYRIHLKLRILLNTTNGSINDIIKVVKFFFSSEIVHIVPNYPAGISIKRDGENSKMDFNRIVRAVVPAGVAYDTTEMFFFTDSGAVSDEQKISVRVDTEETVKIIDMFSAYSSGSQSSDMTTDGVDIGDSITAGTRHHYFRDGTRMRDGTIRRKGMILIPLEFGQQ